MSIYALKPRFQVLLRPLVPYAQVRGATANSVTLAAAVGSILLGTVLVLFGVSHPALFLLAPPWFFLRMALNAMDGMLAREHGQQSRLGAYLNELCDVVSDAALILPFAYVPGMNAALVVIVALLAAMSEFAGALGPLVGAPRRYDGPLGRSDRATLFGAMALWFGVEGTFPSWISIVVIAVILLLATTIINRVRSGLAVANRHGLGAWGPNES